MSERCLVVMDSNSLGDTIGAVPYVDIVQKRDNSELYFQMNGDFVPLFLKSYPNIKFISKNVDVEKDFEDIRHVRYHSHIPLQQGLAESLGLQYIPLRPKIDVLEQPRPMEEKYVTLAIQSTNQSKYWNHKDGWNKICVFLKRFGLKPVCIDLFKEFGSPVPGEKRNKVPSESVKKVGMNVTWMAHYIRHSEFFIGVSSGLSWLAWGVGKPVVMISGVTEPWNEFPCIRLHNDDVCNGCFNYPDTYKFRADKWMWCPKKNNFICTKAITPFMVMTALKENFPQYFGK